MTIQEMIKRIQDLKSFEALRDQVDTEIDALKDEIKAEMGDQEEAYYGDYRVTYKTVTSSRIDSKALKEALGDQIVQKYSKDSSYRKLLIK